MLRNSSCRRMQVRFVARVPPRGCLGASGLRRTSAAPTPLETVLLRRTPPVITLSEVAGCFSFAGYSLPRARLVLVFSRQNEGIQQQDGDRQQEGYRQQEGDRQLQDGDMQLQAGDRQLQDRDKQQQKGDGQQGDRRQQEGERQLLSPALMTGFHDRMREQAWLERLLAVKPSSMRVILGPANCGKTAVLLRVLQNMDNALLIDLRGMDATTPASLIAAMLQQLVEAAPPPARAAAVQQLLSTAPTVAGLLLAVLKGIKSTFRSVGGDSEVSTTASPKDTTFSFKDTLEALEEEFKSKGFQPAQKQDLNAVYQALGALVAAWEQAIKSREGVQQCAWPVLVIDEANVILRWSDTYPEELAGLLRLLVKISKQDNRCHVIMATSEFGFQNWLEQEVGQGAMRTYVIGDFPEAEARRFFEGMLQRWGMVVDDATWHKVFEVGGGNAGFLLSLATDVIAADPDQELDWDGVLADQTQLEYQKIGRLALGGKELGWSGAQYAAAALALLDSKNHSAVPQLEMEVLLGQFDVLPGASQDQQQVAGRVVLLRMVAANALAVRPASTLAEDIPRSAFIGNEPLVTAPSAVSLYCMRRRRQELEMRVQRGQNLFWRILDLAARGRG